MTAAGGTVVVWFTRALRVHDHPALAAACADASRVVPVFVLDEGILQRPIASPNKLVFLLDTLRDLTSAVRERGGALLKRRGDPVAVLPAVVGAAGADAVYTASDVTAYSQRRLRAVRAALDVPVRTFPGLCVHEPGTLTTSAGGAYKVFTPYWRSWRDAGRRPLADAPAEIRTPTTLTVGRVPPVAQLVDPRRTPSPGLPAGGERAARALADRWYRRRVGEYADGHDDLAGDLTSRLSPHLHLGTISPLDLVQRADRRNPGAEAFVRQLCWRDFHHQVLADDPRRAWRDVRSQGDRWRDDPDQLAAWQEGRTGFPLVDAGLRQLRREGWMHNRTRMLVASFLTRELYLDWRAGARHFLAWLVDGDIANNQLNWQWVAGTGTVSRPNRTFNPVTQAERHDPDGDYVRRYVPELRSVPGSAVHRPWELPSDVRDRLDYPDPIVQRDAALAAFRHARGIA